MILRARTTKPIRKSRSSSLAFESLEPRQMLTAAPTVVDVTVAGTAWAGAYVDYLASHSLGTGGYSIPDGGSAQLKALPWNNLDQIKVTFSEDVDVDALDLVLTGTNGGQYQFSGFGYDSQTHVATWTLSSSIGADKLLIDLAADGLDPIVDLDDSLVLDGEWTDGSSSFASGNGTQGGDFEFRVNVLPGDVSQDSLVSAVDYGRVYAKRNTSTTVGAYDPILDVNGSGDINATDYQFVQGKLGTCLPSGYPAGMSNDAPTSIGSDTVSSDEDAAEYFVSLWDAFDDLENDDDELTYEIVSITNAGLFASLSIDTDYGNLIVNTSDNANGIAEIVVRATDAGGLQRDMIFEIDVTAINDAPEISDFFATTEILDIWIITGNVSDVDNICEGAIVYFYGVLEGYQATVEADGSFELIVQLDPYVYGSAWAQTSDIYGALSNTPLQFIGVT